VTYTELLKPDHLTSRAEALTRRMPVPNQPGVYAWYFEAKRLNEKANLLDKLVKLKKEAEKKK
jgi:hypothetical protein